MMVMIKREFLKELENKLLCLPKAEVEGYLAFYSEMIDDYIEDGFSEEEAVAAAGSVEKIAENIIAETPITKLVKQKIKPKRRLSALEIVLLVLGSPIWLALMIVFVAVVLVLCLALWLIIICLWAVYGAILACCFGAFAAGVIFLFEGDTVTGLVMLAAGVVCVGLCILLFFLIKLITKGIMWLIKLPFRSLKKVLVKRRERND
jgi:uncharacterized membrane protein